MKSLPYEVQLHFAHEYWRYLAAEKCDCTRQNAEKCDCTRQKHVACHKNMMDFLVRLDDWDTGLRLHFPTMLRRMTEFEAFTTQPALAKFAIAVITRIKFIQEHKMV